MHAYSIRNISGLMAALSPRITECHLTSVSYVFFDLDQERSHNIRCTLPYNDRIAQDRVQDKPKGLRI